MKSPRCVFTRTCLCAEGIFRRAEASRSMAWIVLPAARHSASARVTCQCRSQDRPRSSARAKRRRCRRSVRSRRSTACPNIAIDVGRRVRPRDAHSKITRAFHRAWSPSQPAPCRQGAGFHSGPPPSSRTRFRRRLPAGCPGHRRDRQRQDRGVPSADPAPADRHAARHDARAGAHADARAAAQILEQLQDLAVHTPVTGAAIFGGVGMGPQEHAFRSGVDVIVATPGRLLDHLRQPVREARRARVPRARRGGPDARHGLPARHPARSCAHLPTQRQTLFFSATMPPPIATLAREMLQQSRRRSTCERARRRRPSASRRRSIRSPQELKSALLLAAAQARRHEARRSSSRAPSTAPTGSPTTSASTGINAERIHGNRSQAQRTEALAGSRAASIRVLVATDIAARGIDVEALGHVVNFDVPPAPDDYIHRVGRTGRAEATGDAFTFVSPEEGASWRHRARVGRPLPRVTVPDFDYAARPAAGSRCRWRSGSPRIGHDRDNVPPELVRRVMRVSIRVTAGITGQPKASGTPSNESPAAGGGGARRRWLLRGRCGRPGARSPRRRGHVEVDHVPEASTSMPRAAMSVATRTGNVPLLKPRARVAAPASVAVHRPPDARCGREVGEPVGAVLGAREDERLADVPRRESTSSADFSSWAPGSRLRRYPRPGGLVAPDESGWRSFSRASARSARASSH